MIIDTHCHLNDCQFDDDRINIINNFSQDNIKSAFVVGTDMETCKSALALAKCNKSLRAIIGMYPENAKQYNKEFENFLRENATGKKVVAIGEIGLDYHTTKDDIQVQKEVFSSQIKLAGEFGLPLSIHTRDAFNDTLEILTTNKKYLHGGVIHCFSGSPEIAQKFIDLGFKLGFGGVCTFKNAKKVVDTLKIIKDSDILLETDAPYLAPEPLRGTINEPKNTNIVLKKIAEIRGQNIEKLEEIIFQNTIDTFKKYKLLEQYGD